MTHSSIADRFSAMLTLLLLALYTFTTLLLLNSIFHWVPLPDVNDGTISIHTTIGGLFSALVVTQLAITLPGENPASRLITPDTPQRARGFFNSIVFVYLSVWVAVGFVSLIVGVALYAGANQTLSDSGTVWLGTAVAATYAYLGIRPN